MAGRNSKPVNPLDAPMGRRTTVIPRRPVASRDRFGRATEAIARAMGTPFFLIGLTLFCVVWIVFNSVGPESLRFDSAAIGFTALTLILSLQASYAAPLILLAQNRQDDRDRVQFEQDRQRAERNLADTEYLAREVVALRLAMQDMASKEFIRAELRSLLDELDRSDRDGHDSHDDREPRETRESRGTRDARGAREARGTRERRVSTATGSTPVVRP